MQGFLSTFRFPVKSSKQKFFLSEHCIHVRPEILPAKANQSLNRYQQNGSRDVWFLRPLANALRLNGARTAVHPCCTVLGTCNSLCSMLLQEVVRGGHEMAVWVLKNFPAIKDDCQEILKALKFRIGRGKRKCRISSGMLVPASAGRRNCNILFGLWEIPGKNTCFFWGFIV